MSATDRAGSNFKTTKAEEHRRGAAAGAEDQPLGLHLGCAIHDRHHCLGEVLAVIPRAVPNLVKANKSLCGLGKMHGLKQILADCFRNASEVNKQNFPIIREACGHFRRTQKRIRNTVNLTRRQTECALSTALSTASFSNLV